MLAQMFFCVKGEDKNLLINLSWKTMILDSGRFPSLAINIRQIIFQGRL
jgi:hypothetical protein